MLRIWLKKEKAISETAMTVPPDIPGMLSIRSVDELLSPHRGMIVQINELAGLSEPNFDRYYRPAMRNFARFVQMLPASEVHHHAGPGGMLTHTLEVCVVSLKLRRSYLLSETGGAEEIAAKQDLWTYAVFLAALCHDLAKVAVDQRVTVYGNDDRSTLWSPWDSFLDEQGIGYTTKFVRGRQYRLHEKASLLLIHRIIPAYSLNWLSGDRPIFAQWLACVSGDTENASSLGEIVGMADGQSVARNLGADSNRMPTVKTKPLHEKMLTALRYLLHKGDLPLNRNGAAGWICGEDCWLVSKRTVDAIREQLTHEGHSGIPTKNGRLFDILQEHGILIPFGDKAIWPAVVEGEGWRNALTLIRIPAVKIWPDPTHRPDEFEGRVIPNNVEKTEVVNETETIAPASAVVTTNTQYYREHESEQDREGEGEQTSKETNANFSPHSEARLNDYDVTDFLPTGTEIVEETQWTATKNKHKSAQEDESLQELAHIEPKSVRTPSVNQIHLKPDNRPQDIERTISELTPEKLIEDPAEHFFEWLRSGIRTDEIKSNRPKARVHVVQEGVALITPGIFQDYAVAQQNDPSEWNAIQKKVLKKHWHVKDDKGLNVIKYQVAGKNKSTAVNVILFQDLSMVFGEATLPTANPHLSRQ
ncbi:MAG: MobH family relaxase [Gammaproteobacteria bacterium]